MRDHETMRDHEGPLGGASGTILAYLWSIREPIRDYPALVGCE